MTKELMNACDSIKTYKVSELNRLVKTYLEDSLYLQSLLIEGEISNITYHRGHIYFTLKDELAAVKCVLFNYAHKKIENNIKQGEAVRIVGHVTLYEATGQYQIIADFIFREEKKGKVYEKFSLLKEKLGAAGYFDEKHKKPIPKIAFNIGVVTSEQGAVIRDIVNTAHKKFSNINIYLYSAKVQGENSDLEIIKGIEVLNSLDFIDVIIIGRGGGSIEDLDAFNSESLAITIFSSDKPIVSAVGHETDFVISDFVADIRAATPTQASEMVTPSKEGLNAIIDQKHEKLNNLLLNNLESKRRRLQNAENSYYLKKYDEVILKKRELLINSERALNNKLLDIINRNRIYLNSKIDLLNSLNPLNIMKKGYSITKKNDIILKSTKELKIGETVETIINDGTFKSIVSEIG